MISLKKSPFLPVLVTAVVALALVAGAAAQDDAPELAPPDTLLDALELPVCAEFKTSAGSAASAETAIQITPEGATDASIFVFDLSDFDRNDVLDLIRFESKDAVAAKAAQLPLQSIEAVADAETSNDADGALYGWLTVFYDADNAALCRTTAYPAIGGADEPLMLVSFQGFIAHLVSAARLDTSRYQADAFCSFETPQYCDAIFMGDDTAENIVGTDGGDLISAAGGNDTVDGRDGDDVIDGGGGDDVIIGGGGSDVISGGDGDDVIYGGSGGDVIRGDAGDDSIEGQEGLDTLDGGEGIDTVNQ
jgi:hypothetical protein